MSRPAVIRYGSNHVLADGEDGRWCWLWNRDDRAIGHARVFPSYAAARRFLAHAVRPVMLAHGTKASEYRRNARLGDAPIACAACGVLTKGAEK